MQQYLSMDLMKVIGFQRSTTQGRDSNTNCSILGLPNISTPASVDAGPCTGLAHGDEARHLCPGRAAWETSATANTCLPILRH